LAIYTVLNKEDTSTRVIYFHERNYNFCSSLQLHQIFVKINIKMNKVIIHLGIIMQIFKVFYAGTCIFFIQNCINCQSYLHLRCEFESLSWRSVQHYEIKFSQWPAGRCFSPGTPVSSSYTTDRHDIAEILLKDALNTITLSPSPPPKKICWYQRLALINIISHTGYIL
jgi:hypothetical protein